MIQGATSSLPLSRIPFLYKPCTHHHLLIEKSIPSTPSNRYYKYIHSLEVTRERHLNSNIATRIKTLTSLKMNKKSHFLRISRVKKFIKHRQRYLKALNGQLKSPQLLKLLPYLHHISLNYDSSNWRLFRTCFNFHHLSIDFENFGFPSFAQRLHRVEKLLKKHKNSFLRGISRQRNLQNLNITLHKGDIETFQIVLHLFHQAHLSTFHLKNFHLKCLAADQWHSKIPVSVSSDVKKVLGNVQKLTLQNNFWFSSVFDGNMLKNLAVLDVKICPKDDEIDLSILSTLQEVNTLQEIKMSFQANNTRNEKQFLEYFRLPVHIEKVELLLMNFKWGTTQLTKKNRQAIQKEFDKNQRFTFFFKHWKELKQLEYFSLTLFEEFDSSIRCPCLAGNFASRIIRQMNSLKNLKFSHSLGSPKYKLFAPLPELPAKPLNFEEFWKALEPSKNTLQGLIINVPELAFPLKMGDLNYQFPWLKSVSLGDHVLGAQDLCYFWSEMKSLKQVEIYQMLFRSDKDFENFLDGIRKIPEEVNLDCALDAANINFKAMEKCLAVFFKEGGIQGGLKLALANLQTKNSSELGRSVMLLEDLAALRKFKITKEINGILLTNIDVEKFGEF